MQRTTKYYISTETLGKVTATGVKRRTTYKLSGSGFESSCSHLNFRFRACFEQGVPWHSGNYRVWIYSETRTWYDKNSSQLGKGFGQNIRKKRLNTLILSGLNQELDHPMKCSCIIFLFSPYKLKTWPV